MQMEMTGREGVLLCPKALPSAMRGSACEAQQGEKASAFFH